MDAFVWFLTLAITATAQAAPSVWPTLAPQSLSLRLRYADGAPAGGVTAQVWQIVQPAGSTAWRDHRRVLAGQCQADAEGRCALSFKLEQPLLYDPELAVLGYEFVGLGGEIGGEEAVDAPAQAFQAYPLPPEAWGQTLAFVLLASRVVVGDLNPAGTPEFVAPPPAVRLAASLEPPWPALAAPPVAPRLSSTATKSALAATTTLAVTPTPCSTCRPAAPPTGWDMRAWSLFLVGGGLLLMGIAGYFLWQRDRRNREGRGSL